MQCEPVHQSVGTAAVSKRDEACEAAAVPVAQKKNLSKKKERSVKRAILCEEKPLKHF